MKARDFFLISSLACFLGYFLDMSPIFFLIALGSASFGVGVYRLEQKAESARLQYETEKESAKMKVEAALKAGDINEVDRNTIVERIDENRLYRSVEEYIEEFKNLKKYQESMILKYGEDNGNRVINHQYWIGMTEEQLLDCKGEPTKIETQVLQTKTKQTYIYGNKNSGDYFVLENGKVVKFIDRGSD
jgi:hypothetical protein